VNDILFLRINVKDQFFGKYFWREVIGWFVYTDKSTRTSNIKSNKSPKIKAHNKVKQLLFFVLRFSGDLFLNSEIAYIPVVVKGIYWDISGKYQSDITTGIPISLLIIIYKSHIRFV
jgi:hypothetical protein